MLKTSHFVAIFALAIGVALFAPSGKNNASGPQFDLSGDAQGQANIGNLQSSDWYGGTTVLERQGDGHFYADALVQGADVRFMVDTGASMVALTGNDAYAAGLLWDESDVRHIGQGASGPVYGITTTISELELGDHVARNVPAAIIPDGLDVSLLGQSFLTEIGNVEISNDKMVMSGSR